VYRPLCRTGSARGSYASAAYVPSPLKAVACAGLFPRRAAQKRG
jgi:hypothetical protein